MSEREFTVNPLSSGTHNKAFSVESGAPGLHEADTIREGEYLTLIHVKRLLIYGSLALITVSFGLMLGWSFSSKEPLFLQSWAPSTDVIPDKDFLFQMHPILLTLGFFSAQAYAMTFMNLLKRSPWATPIHIIFHIIAASCLIAGLASIVMYKNDANDQHLCSLHTWIGVFATTLYLTNFLGGAFGKIPITAVAGPDRKVNPNTMSIIGNMKVYRIAHVLNGLSALCCTMAAIVTGKYFLSVSPLHIPPPSLSSPPSLKYTIIL